MKHVTSKELEMFSTIWLAAGDNSVIDWERWESKVQLLFEIEDPPTKEVFHGLMDAVCAICHGTLQDIKIAMRCLSPTELELGARLLSHLQQVRPLFDAELHFRDDNLVGDWSLDRDSDKNVVVVRSNFKPVSETSH